MNIGSRLEAIANLILPDCVLADIGTDHAYLPVYMLQQQKIRAAIAGDIAEGPCKAAENTVAMYGMKNRVQVRLGSGLSVIKEGEADCISIAGMGGSTIVEILSADLNIARSAKRLVLQPQTGAPGLRKWLLENAWDIIDEELVFDSKRLYEIIVAEKAVVQKSYSPVELEVGPVLISKKHPLLTAQIVKILETYSKQLGFMEKSTNAVQTQKYAYMRQMKQDLEALANDCQ